jgi:hypothetical protein
MILFEIGHLGVGNIYGRLGSFSGNALSRKLCFLFSETCVRNAAHFRLSLHVRKNSFSQGSRESIPNERWKAVRDSAAKQDVIPADSETADPAEIARGTP